MAAERLDESFAAHHDSAELLDALTTGVVLLDAGLHVLQANMAAQGFMAIGLNQARGRLFTELFVDTNGLQGLLVRALDQGEAFSEFELSLRPAGTSRERQIVDLSITRIEAGNGEHRLLLEMIDAVPRTRLNRDNELRARLESSRMMTRQLAHEVKNPLGGLRGAAQLLARQLPDPSLREYTDVIIAEADRLTALVDTMTHSARPSQKERLNIHEVCEHVFRLMTAESAAGVVVERDYDPSVPEGYFDRHQLVQALLNVTRNALQAVGSHGRIVLRTRAVPHVHIGLVRHRLAARIEVLDDGPGVPDAIRSSLFFPLVTARANGTGLGLAVSQELVNRNGGVIEFESEPGRTVFRVLLPLETAP